jgi:hypothetical protein
VEDILTEPSREFPDVPLLGFRTVGSFDYVVVRYANDNSAQDDMMVRARRS